MTEPLDGFRERYTTAFDDYVGERDEATLRTAYELGREAVSNELTVQELAVVHHHALISALGASAAEGQAVTDAACEFFVESLSAFEMVTRGFREAREAALLEQRHAAILRQLSNFLIDASLALDAAGSLEEMLQLVVEQARELLGATRCDAHVTIDGETMTTIESSSAANGGAPDSPHEQLSARLVGWDGRELGTIDVFDKIDGGFTEVDSAVLIHVAQMASAAVERAQLYRRIL
jgi:hypothetical protein